jgi:hypothetical protein
LDNACDTVGKSTSTVSGQELPGQCAHENDGVNSVDKATDVNGDPSKDSDHTIDAKTMTVDESDCIFDNVEVNTVAEENDTYGHPIQESDVIVDAENSNIDGLDTIYDSSKTIDTNVEQTELIVDFDVNRNDVLQKESPVQSAHESEEINTVEEATDVNGDPSKDSYHTIDAETMTVDEPDCIFDSVEVNTLDEENNVHDVCIEETGIQIDIDDSNIDEPNIHGSSKTNDGNNEQTESSIDDDVKQNDVSQKIFKAYKLKLVIRMLGWKMQMRQQMFVEKLPSVI